MKICAIIPAAGIGCRMKSEISKPFLRLKNKFIFLHTLEKICECKLIDEVVLVIGKKLYSKVNSTIKKIEFRKVRHLVVGGKYRAESVLNGLKYVSEEHDYVLIHDGARPLITQKVIVDCINALINNNYLAGAIVGVPVKYTIKKVYSGKKIVQSTLDRSTLWEIQTPQIFKRASLVEAYNNIPSEKLKHYSDDSQVLEKVKVKIKVVRGDEINIKITTPSDLVVAEAVIDSINRKSI